MDKVKYILFEADFDESEVNIYKLCNLDSIDDFFYSPDEAIEKLLKGHTYVTEWMTYHLIKLEDFK